VVCGDGEIQASGGGHPEQVPERFEEVRSGEADLADVRPGVVEYGRREVPERARRFEVHGVDLVGAARQETAVADQGGWAALGP
jgi:hypothetical protein